jgi:aryl-alcohol dehydrogenase-like predicted oxidoreductase
MITRTLGRTGPEVSALGLGCMGMSDLYGPADRAESLATIHAALEAGITLLDTGDFYGMGHNELLIREAIAGRARESVVISVKFGALRDTKGAWLGVDGRPAAVKSFLAYTLRRLDTDYVDVYRLTRLDPAVHPVSDLQIEYSLFSRGIEEEILPTARELGIGITAYGVLSRGLLSGRWSKERTTGPGDIRSHLPRFGADGLVQNLALVEALRAVAQEKGLTVARAAVAWVLSRGTDIVPLIGARSRGQLDEALGVLDAHVTPDDLAAIEGAAPASAVAGDRYPAVQMAHLDSERGSSQG